MPATSANLGPGFEAWIHEALRGVEVELLANASQRRRAPKVRFQYPYTGGVFQSHAVNSTALVDATARALVASILAVDFAQNARFEVSRMTDLG